jgi:hypothetical protein
MDINDFQFSLEIINNRNEAIFDLLAIGHLRVIRESPFEFRNNGVLKTTIWMWGRQAELLSSLLEGHLYNPQRYTLHIKQTAHAESFNTFNNCFIRSVTVAQGNGLAIMEAEWIFNGSQTTINLPVELRPEREQIVGFEIWESVGITPTRPLYAERPLMTWRQLGF